uniref:Uncharacterized protein n=1 Tax=Romanomermis culicivorax TaxID=13658 RepID=A0A915K9Y0_ROMCU
MKWNLDSLYGRLNYSLSIYLPAQLKCQECVEDDAIQDKRTISVSHSSIALLFCHWRVSDSRFWTDWFEFSMNRMFKI